MIIRYETSTGNILGYTKVGGSIPETPEENNSYLRWNGITPEPPKDYKVLNGQVVEKSDEEKQELIDAQLKRAEEGRKAASQTIIREEVDLTEVLERLSVLEGDVALDYLLAMVDMYGEAINDLDERDPDLSLIEERLEELERIPEEPEISLEEQVRAKRDDLLSSTDYVELPSVRLKMPRDLRLAWYKYRKLLREIPQQEGFPEDIDWPVAPGENNG